MYVYGAVRVGFVFVFVCVCVCVFVCVCQSVLVVPNQVCLHVYACSHTLTHSRI